MLHLRVVKVVIILHRPLLHDVMRWRAAHAVARRRPHHARRQLHHHVTAGLHGGA